MLGPIVGSQFLSIASERKRAARSSLSAARALAASTGPATLSKGLPSGKTLCRCSNMLKRTDPSTRSFAPSGCIGPARIRLTSLAPLPGPNDMQPLNPIVTPSAKTAPTLKLCPISRPNSRSL